MIRPTSKWVSGATTMAITKLSCPDCGTVLRPAKPVEAGKKVKCPKCELVFVAGDDEDEPPRRSSAKGGKAKKGAPAVKEAPKKEEEEIYGYIKDPDEDDEDARPRIEYAPDESIRDLRGPAIVKLTPPGSKLQLVGMAGVLGWVVLFILLLIPTVFPIQSDGGQPSPVMALPRGLGAVDPGAGGGGFGGFMGGGGGGAAGGEGKKMEEEKGGFFELFGVDLSVWFLILMVPLILCMVYSSMVVAGGIKMVNLESRTFGIVGSIMAMIPLHVSGLQTVLTLILVYLSWLFFDEVEFGQYVAMGVSSIVYLLSLAVGIWSLMTLMDQDVIDGFEFNPD